MTTGAQHPSDAADFDLRIDLRGAVPADADDVAALLTQLGYPCEPADAAERIATVLHNDRQALMLARLDGAVCGLMALDYMYYLPLDTTTWAWRNMRSLKR